MADFYTAIKAAKAGAEIVEDRHGRRAHWDYAQLWWFGGEKVIVTADLLDANWTIKRPLGPKISAKTPAPWQYKLRDGEDSVARDQGELRILKGDRLRGGISQGGLLSEWADYNYDCLVYARQRRDGSVWRREAGQARMWWDEETECWHLQGMSGPGHWCVPVAVKRGW